MAQRRPNVILVITDDQGYADLGCTGNPWIQTPNIDAFHDDAVRFTDFHVSPLCTPTRGALMSGHRPIRNGAWATCWGRSIMGRNETTLADTFANSGYATGLFGKWHLGDNYPFRPFDRGFQHVVAHKGGGVGQTPDFWGNDYFDDTYFHNGQPVQHEGYCTDVWFEEALKFIDQHREEPFFAMISTNAPHGPYLVGKEYLRLYQGNPEIPEPAFYGMITNIDENFGRLRANLAALGIEDNTILIFMTDNGSSGSCELDADFFPTRGYNAGLRGKKGHYYDGGHKVPFFVRWPSGSLAGGRDIDEMCLHIDLLPTFVDILGLTPPKELHGDGTSLGSLVRGEADRLPGDRVQFLQYRQNTNPPDKWENCVMTRQWRLVYGKELYDIKADPGQRHDVAADHPDVVARLRQAHEEWWAEVSPGLTNYQAIVIGNDAENPMRLDAMDVMGDVAWNQCHIALAQRSTGRWTVEVDRPGRYRFALRRWPQELGLPIEAKISASEAAQLAPYGGFFPPGQVQAARARLGLFGVEQTIAVAEGAEEAVFELDLAQAGKTELEAWFDAPDGSTCGAYYVYVERL